VTQPTTGPTTWPPQPPVTLPPTISDSGDIIKPIDNKTLGATKSGTSITGPTLPPELPPLLPATQSRKAEENTGINLSGSFEKWGVPPQKTLDSARMQQLKQVLQRIPAQFRASLEIIYTDKEGEGNE
jgi:hypothetical protein